MAGPDTPRVDGVPCGVFGWRPPASLVVELSALLDGVAAMSTQSRLAASCLLDRALVVQAASGLLAVFNQAGVLNPADVHTAETVCRIGQESTSGSGLPSP